MSARCCRTQSATRACHSGSHPARCAVFAARPASQLYDSVSHKVASNVYSNMLKSTTLEQDKGKMNAARQKRAVVCASRCRALCDALRFTAACKERDNPHKQKKMTCRFCHLLVSVTLFGHKVRGGHELRGARTVSLVDTLARGVGQGRR
ncbi:hypothetical protein E2C01_038261 [Portunus trituberculatus]|uniref:Uncharacterized protein n=1 Tax=Portunus trituberculatus TaxID=210409 RepID=A0A5B7FHJ1_PORTR|nr:hypothetical protein [Portunus trituberculatus]